jgi:hypothetical protein
MSSGQQREIYNNAERAMSDDQNRQQAFIARERNEIIRALVQQTRTSRSPGVTVRDQSGSPSAPFSAVVLDGLEAIVDVPGVVLVSGGVLAGWVGNNITTLNADSGFVVVDSLGQMDAAHPAMQIPPNAGGAPRCDVVEVSIVVDSSVTYENRDIYDEATENFIPASVAKTARSELAFRVRVGTPGEPPGVAAGWLPLALAIVQPGASLATVDFYDVRPLYRDLRGEASHDGAQGDATTSNRRSNHAIVCSGDGTLAGSAFDGRVEADWMKTDISGELYRNTPCSVDDLAEWGSTVANVGGDSRGVPLTTATAVRGTAVAVNPFDTVILCAVFPTLNSNVGPLPRMVRYTQEAANNGSLVPARRRPQGVNGLLMWVAKSQEGGNLTVDRSYYPIPINAPAFGGCVGNGYAVPLALASANRLGTGIRTTRTGILQGASVRDGIPIAANQLMAIEDLAGVINSTIAAAVEYPDGGPGFPVGNGSFEDELALAGDRIDIDVGRLVMFLVETTTTDPGSAGVHIRIIEDAEGTPLVHTLSEWETVAPGVSIDIRKSWQRSLVLTRSGVLRIELALYNALGTTVVLTSVTGWNGVWGTYRRYRL